MKIFIIIRGSLKYVDPDGHAFGNVATSIVATVAWNIGGAIIVAGSGGTSGTFGYVAIGEDGSFNVGGVAWSGGFVVSFQSSYNASTGDFQVFGAVAVENNWFSGSLGEDFSDNHVYEIEYQDSFSTFFDELHKNFFHSTDLVYINQKENGKGGGRQCMATSIVMKLLGLGGHLPNEWTANTAAAKLDKQIRGISDIYKVGNISIAFAQKYLGLSVDKSLKKTKNFSELRSFVDDNGAITVGTHLGGSTGHVLDIKSYNQNGFNVFDSAGNWHKGYFNKGGQNAFYENTFVGEQRNGRHFGGWVMSFYSTFGNYTVIDHMMKQGW